MLILKSKTMKIYEMNNAVKQRESLINDGMMTNLRRQEVDESEPAVSAVEFLG